MRTTHVGASMLTAVRKKNVDRGRLDDVRLQAANILESSTSLQNTGAQRWNVAGLDLRTVLVRWESANTHKNSETSISSRCNCRLMMALAS